MTGHANCEVHKTGLWQGSFFEKLYFFEMFGWQFHYKLTEILENDGSADEDWFLSMDDVLLQC